MLTRRAIVLGGLAMGGLTSALGARGASAQPLGGAAAPTANLPPASADPFQALIDTECARARMLRAARLALVLGVVDPQGQGRLLFAGGADLTNPLGQPLALDAKTPFEIGSISKVFTSSLHFKRHGPFEGTLGTWLGGSARLSPAVEGLRLANLATYRPGLPQDNQGGAYPPRTMAGFQTLFDFLSTYNPPMEQGACYAYSNLGWALLAMAGTGIAGADADGFAERYDRRLGDYCASFGAGDTGWFRPGMKARLPLGYTKQWQALPRDASYRPTHALAVGAGGIVSTGADMLAYLRLNMGLAKGGLSDPALAYQQGADFSASACAGGRASRTAYGWFRADATAPRGRVTVLTKDGGVAGFTAWMGFSAWQGSGKPSGEGVFVLCNGPSATPIGVRAMKLLLGV
ncbi:serine hydrolase domain-containing protein [Roseixanthobacter pseudopolyaromaticivorans]|uniref:serine hydrolase domain-containing protein n=1 Tax=Xanthobacteraceae TaxID=335928 RepID=UPI00372767D5